MPSVRTFLPVVAALLAAPTLAAEPLHAQPRTLSDSTVIQSWKLENGLAVTTRHIPGAASVALAVAFPFGTESDPLKREGLATVAAYAFELGAAPPVPDRTEEAMERLRPQGWNVETDRRATRITEAVPKAQFPGTLHEIALRLKGVQVSEATLAEARRLSVQELQQKYFKRMDWALYHQLRAVAAGDSADRADRYAQGSAVAKNSLADVRAALKERFVPANAALSIAGDLSGVDLLRLVQSEFGGIPAGRKLAAPPPRPLRSAVRWSAHPEALDLVAAMGIFAPPVTDSTHASFLANMLCAGSYLTSRWGRLPEIPSRFRYSVVDDPEMVVFFPPVDQVDADSLRVHNEYGFALAAFVSTEISIDKFNELRQAVYWLIGGAMSPQQLANARSSAPFLMLLAGAAAAREHRGGEAFWSEYRKRFEAITAPDVQRWYPLLRDRTHQAYYFFNPGVAIEK